MVNMMLPLLKRQKYIHNVDIYRDQKIDIDLNLFKELAMNLGETYLVTENGNERLGKQKLDLVVL